MTGETVSNPVMFNNEIINYSLIILVRMKLLILAATVSAQYEMDEDYDKNIRPSKSGI